MDSYDLSLSYIALSGGTINNVEFIISKPPGTEYTLQNGASTTCNEKSKKPGQWQIKATATLSSGIIIYSNTVNVTVQYPDVNTIRSANAVSSKMASVWTQTKNAASSSGQREKGFVIYVNTTSMSYECGPTIDGDIVSCTTGSINITGNDAIPGSPLNGGKYIVADFHTHPPLTYCPTNTVRPVGPSSTDISGNMPGLVYDYTGSSVSGVTDNAITGGHNINAAAQIYTSGPNRRPTPN
jgi:hypothetical protein